MSLDSGYYRIFNGDELVGRVLHETMDLTPKRVFNRTDDKDAVWIVEALRNGRHRLHAKGAPTAVGNNKPAGPLVALLIGQGDAAEWRLVAVEGREDTFRIVSREGASWVALEPGRRCKIEVLSLFDDSVPTAAFTFRRFRP